MRFCKIISATLAVTLKAIATLILLPPPVWASAPIRPAIQCPADLTTLTPLLLRDLPSYANRVSQRAYTNFRTADLPGYVILADRPEYAPLSLNPENLNSARSSRYPQGVASPNTEDQPAQIFFTTLERQYVSGKPVSLQHYHRVFLVETEEGWQLALMFSTIGNYPADQPPTPPQDTSQGVIAQAIRLWLRDCRAGSVAGSVVGGDRPVSNGTQADP
jgi:hypothetical protein